MMKKIFLTIALIVLASSIYIAYKWVSFDEGGATNQTKSEEKKQVDDVSSEPHIGESKSRAHDEFWNDILKGFNEQTHLLFNEESFHILGFKNNISLFSILDENMETTVTSHTHHFDDQGQPVSETFNEAYGVKEEYELNQDIKGIISYSDESEEYSFIQTDNKYGDFPMIISNSDIKSIEEFKDILDNLNLPEEKQYSEEEFIDLVDMNLDDLLAFNLDAEGINLNGMDIFKYDGKAEITIYYEIDIDGEEIFTSISINETINSELPGQAIELDNGRTLNLLSEEYANYVFTENGYDYNVTFLDKETDKLDKKEAILEHLNVPLFNK